MKKVAWKWKKMLLLTGMVSAMGLAVCACGDAKGEAGQEVPQGIEGEPISEEGDKSEDAVQESAADEGGKDSGGGVAESEETAQSSEGKETDAWPDSAPDLKGDIKEIAEGQITVVEAVEEELEDGSEAIMVVAPGAEGDDSGFNKVTVTYDEDTLFAVQNIYEGGARYDLSEATAEDMATGQFINVWGRYSGSSLEATRICIVKVDGVSG